MRRPVTTVMFYVALAAVGLIASRLLPLEYFPDIEFPGIFIEIPYQGSSPEEVERRITRPIEEALATLSGVERMESSSRENQSQIRLFFSWDEEVSTKGIDARVKIDSIRNELPADLQRILVFTGSTSDQPILVLRISSNRDLSDAYDLLDRHLKRRIERLEGVSRVELQGVEPHEIRILLDADRVAAHGIDLPGLKVLLEKSNFAVSAGRITEGGQRLNVRPKGEFASLDDIRNTIIDEGNLRLGDVAEVELLSPERNYGRHLDGRYAIGLNVYKATGANMVAVADRVKEEVEKIGELPQMQGIRIFDLDNQAQGVRDSLSDLLSAGLIGALLAIVVLYLFLRQLSTTLIVTAAVPFSLLITLAAMYFFGLSMNILSMMGLMLAVGMLVDNAVVVTESIFRYRQDMPDDPVNATLLGVKEVGLAVVAGTATSIIVFAPMLFGTKADITVFLGHVALTIVVALIASLLIAQTLVPMLASRVPAPPKPKPGALMSRLTERYARSLNWTLRHPWWTLVGIVLLVASSIIPMKMVQFDTWPQDYKRRLFMPYHIEGDYPLEQIEGVVDRVEGFLFENKQKLDIVSVYSYFDNGRAESTILLTDDDEATMATEDIIEYIEDNIPEIVIGKPSFKFDQESGGEGFSLQVSGDSTEQLTGISKELIRVLSTIDGLQSLRSDAAAGEREIRVSVDRIRATQLGLSTEQIAKSIATAMRGDNLREFRGKDNEIAVRLAFRDSDKQSIEQLADLPLYTADGRRVRLASVASFRVSRAPQTIQRVDRQTAVVISANLAKDSSLDEIKPRVEKLMEQFELPPGYSWKFGRGFERQDETQQIMAENILLGIALIFLVMAALFESVLYPISIMISILFSIVGVLWFFFLTGTTFSFMASIWIMILIGVVVNNGIVLVDHINNLRREGMGRKEAVIESGRDRLRPILMTVATTILGLSPLAMGTTQVGGDGPPYFPMARAIIGGLAFSTVVSLLVVPTVYLWLDSLSRWSRKVIRVARRGRDVPANA
ncbi:MAG: efflux RND transporter permease subunit [Gammaproteobacteria bacterium]